MEGSDFAKMDGEQVFNYIGELEELNKQKQGFIERLEKENKIINKRLQVAIDSCWLK